MQGIRSATRMPARSTASTFSGLFESSRTLARPKESQNLPGQLVVAQIRLETQPLVGFHGIGALILQFVGAQLVKQADSAAFLMLVDQQPAAFVGDPLERQFKLRAAIAAQAMEDIAGQALRMDPHQRRRVAGETSPIQHDRLFDGRSSDRPSNP